MEIPLFITPKGTLTIVFGSLNHLQTDIKKTFRNGFKGIKKCNFIIIDYIINILKFNLNYLN
tara:strand:+ start:410 stop:595 length:186 start_codon:yes stop_codon:yes gene_type:complete